MALADLTSLVAELHEFKIRDWLFTSVRLPFNMQPQTQTNWCWAATATSTSIFYRPASSWTQCSVANGELGLTTCCDCTVPRACNVTWFLDRALTRTRNYVSMTGPISFSAVQAELQAGRVLGARIGWSGGGGHFMVIYGCGTANGVEYFNIDDPIYGKSSPSVVTFSNNYQGSGSWTHTYYTKAAPIVFKFRLPEIAQRWVNPILQARPLLAPHGERGFKADAERLDSGVSLGMATPVHVLGLDDLVKGRRMSKEPVAIRVLETRGEEIAAFYDMSPSAEAAEVLQMASSDNDYVGLLERGMAVATRWAQEQDTETDLKLVRIPALYTEAIVLQRGGKKGDVAIVIRSPQEGVPLFTPMPLDDLTERLKAPARLLLADDDELKGS